MRSCSPIRNVIATLVLCGATAVSADDALQPPVPEMPVVHIIEPADGQLLSGVVRIAVKVSGDQPIESITVSAGGLTIGAAVSAPYEVSWDTRREIDGPYALVAHARHLAFGEVSSPRIQVTLDNTAPTIAWVRPKDGEAVTGTVALEATPADLLGVRAVRFLVNGVSVGEVTAPPYTFAWETAGVPNIRCALEARALDRVGNSAATPPVVVKVSNTNHHPVLETIEPQQIPEGQPFVLTIKASDPDGARDPLTYRAEPLPPWMQLDAHTGVLQGTPDFSEASLEQPQKDYPAIQVEACDPEPRCDTQAFTLSVINVNHPPVLEPLANQSIGEGEPLRFALAAHDPDGDSLTCRGTHLPPWARFNDSTCTVAGRAPVVESSSGEAQETYAGVAFEVCDPQPLCTSQTMSITVANVENQAPMFEPVADQRADEGRPWKLTVRATDADGAAPTLEPSELPQGCAFTDDKNGSGTFAWTPRWDQAGTYLLAVGASDGSLMTIKRIPLAVRERSLAISGTIVDVQSNQPLPGAVVRINTAGETAKEVTTDAQGVYLAYDLSQGNYLVKPSYEVSGEFNIVAHRPSVMVFDPAVQPVTLGAADQTHIDFSARLKD